MVRTGIASLAVFVLWMILDAILHGVILNSTYAMTPQFWRIMTGFEIGLNAVVVLISSACFVLIYAHFITRKGRNAALIYSLILGFARGVSMGYGTYAVMPIPHTIALAWFLGAVVEYVLGGFVMSLIVKPKA